MTSSRRLRRVLLVGANDVLTRRTLQTFAIAHHPVWIASSSKSRSSAASSRWCRGLTTIDDPADFDQIRAAARWCDATHVIPTDIPSSLALADRSGELAPVNVYPLATRDVLTTTHDKASFFRTCLAAEIPVPETVVLDAPVGPDGHGLEYPVVLKPTDRDAGEGVRFCDGRDDFDRLLAEWPTFPQIVQRFVPGRDVDLSVLAVHGRVVASAVQETFPTEAANQGFRFFDDSEVAEIGSRFIATTAYHGLAHLDLRRARDGTVVMLECNPRMYASMRFAALVGVNFPLLGLDVADGVGPSSRVTARPGIVCGGGIVHLRTVAALRAATTRPTARAIGAALLDPAYALSRAREILRHQS